MLTFPKCVPRRSSLPHAQGISTTVGQTKNPQLDNAKVSQEWDRRSTKDTLSLARRVHVTRSILPNLGNNTKDRTHWPHWSLLFFFFTSAVFEIFKARQKTQSPVGRPELSSCKCHQKAQEFTGRQRAHWGQNWSVWPHRTFYHRFIFGAE